MSPGIDLLFLYLSGDTVSIIDCLDNSLSLVAVPYSVALSDLPLQPRSKLALGYKSNCKHHAIRREKFPKTVTSRHHPLIVDLLHLRPSLHGDSSVSQPLHNNPPGGHPYIVPYSLEHLQNGYFFTHIGKIFGSFTANHPATNNNHLRPNLPHTS